MDSILVDLVFPVVGFLALLVASAYFSGSETAIFSLSELELEELERDGAPARERRIALLARSPYRTLVTLLLSNMVVNVVLSVTVTTLLLRLLGEAGLGVAIASVSVALVLFGEILPKTLGLRHGRRWALQAAGPIVALSWLLGPVRSGLERLATAASGSPQRRPLDRDELTTLVQVTREEGGITPFEARVLGRILRFSHVSLERVLTPRVDMTAASVDVNPEEIATLFEESGYSRLPVYEGDVDNIVGILLLKDFLTRGGPGAQGGIRALMRAPFFVPESLEASRLFREFQQRRTHIAVVVGEHGGVEGIVTLEDLLEELVGDIQDETDSRDVAVVALDDGSWRVDAAVELDELGEALGLGLALEGEEAVTLAGLLEQRLGRVPRSGDVVEHGDLRFHVITATATRPLLIRVARTGSSR